MGTIAQEIQRIYDAVNDSQNGIKAAISAKGVTVPSDAKIDGLATLIASIQGPIAGVKIGSHTVNTASQRTETIDIVTTETIGFEPRIFILYKDVYPTVARNMVWTLYIKSGTRTWKVRSVLGSSATSAPTNSTSVNAITQNDAGYIYTQSYTSGNNSYLKLMFSNSSTYRLPAGLLKWVAIQ